MSSNTDWEQRALAARAAAVRATGRWPVLLALVHGAVRDAVTEGGDPAAELTEVPVNTVCSRLRRTREELARVAERWPGEGGAR